MLAIPSWAAVQRLPRPETLSTPALTPCYTNLSDQQTPTPLTFPHDTQQSKLINSKDADSSKAEYSNCNSQRLTDLDVSPPFDRNNEIHNQDTSNGSQTATSTIQKQVQVVNPAELAKLLLKGWENVLAEWIRMGQTLMDDYSDTYPQVFDLIVE